MLNQSAQPFATTHWTTALNARDGSMEALESLCRAYWYPLYSFVRRKGNSPEESQDLVQGFFEQFLQKEYLRNVDRDKGKFRNFLQASISHFLANEWDKRNRVKRGGGCAIISIDTDQAEGRFQCEPQDPGLTPDAAFDRAWAQTVVERVLDELRAEYVKAGETDRFEALGPCLMGVEAQSGYQAIGVSLGLGEGGVKTVVRRMRLRFAALLRQELAETLADPAQSEAEMRYLIQRLLL